MKADVTKTAPVSLILRTVNKINLIIENNIELLYGKVNQILILFSGTESEYFAIRKYYESYKDLEVIWVYSFGYPEPAINGVFNKIKSEWIMHLFDRDTPSKDLVASLNYLTNLNYDGFMIKRTVDSFENRKNLSKWLVEFLAPGFRKKFNFVPILYKKDVIDISDVIHTQYKIRGKILYLDQNRYYVTQTYNVKETKNDDTFIEHWREKEKRYIFIELFITRKSRLAALSKIIESLPLLDRINLDCLSSKSKFLNSELTNFEYVLFEMIRNLSWGKIGLNVYQKVKLATLRETRKINTTGFLISEYMRIHNKKIIEIFNIKSSIVTNENSICKQLINTKDTEILFVECLLENFLNLINKENSININETVQEIQRKLSKNVEKFMPL